MRNLLFCLNYSSVTISLVNSLLNFTSITGRLNHRLFLKERTFCLKISYRFSNKKETKITIRKITNRIFSVKHHIHTCTVQPSVIKYLEPNANV